MTLNELKKSWGIGLTGGIATGKSTLANILRELSYLVIDADQLSRKVVLPGSATLAKIALIFGNDLLNKDLSLNRSRLKDIVMKDPVKRQELEKIMHPAIGLELDSILINEGLLEKPKLWFYEAALLVETGNHINFKEIWLTNCKEETQISRLIERDNIHIQAAHEIISSQWPFSKKAPFAQIVFDTELPRQTLYRQVLQRLDQLKA